MSNNGAMVINVLKSIQKDEIMEYFEVLFEFFFFFLHGLKIHENLSVSEEDLRSEL
jgi:hypothetical protein